MKKFLIVLLLVFGSSCLFAYTVDDLQKDIESFLTSGSYVKVYNTIDATQNPLYFNKARIQAIKVFYYEGRGFGLSIDGENYSNVFFEISLDENNNFIIKRIKENPSHY